jgi:hypothetical protein
MLYTPSYPATFEDVSRELDRISRQTVEPEPIIMYFQTSYAAPAKPVNGMLVRADGAVWNPGAGAGIYERNGGAWVKI